jgi:hypothetical protein
MQKLFSSQPRTLGIITILHPTLILLDSVQWLCATSGILVVSSLYRRLPLLMFKLVNRIEGMSQHKSPWRRWHTQRRRSKKSSRTASFYLDLLWIERILEEK